MGWAGALGVWMARGNCPTTEVYRCVSHVLWQLGSLSLFSVPAAQAATPELSTQYRLQDRREVTAGQRVVRRGLRGRPLLRERLAHHRRDGRRLGAAAEARRRRLVRRRRPVGRARPRSSSAAGATRATTCPTPAGCTLQRTDFAPDGRPRRAVRAQTDQPGAADKTVTVKVDAHSELMSAYPWGFSGGRPNAADNLARPRRVRRTRRCSSPTTARCPARPSTTTPRSSPPTRTPAPATRRRPAAPTAAPRPSNVCAANDGTSMPSACDDGPYGKGTGGELRYQVTVPARRLEDALDRRRRLRQGPRRRAERARRRAARSRPASSPPRSPSRDRRSAASTQVDLPGDPLLQHAIDWGKQNLADVTQTASDLQIRWTNQGKQFPPRSGTVAHARWFGAGYPDYPWIFATDGEYTNFAAVALGQFETAEDHLRALRDISDVLNDRSGIVVARDRLRRRRSTSATTRRRPRPTARRRTTSTPTRRSSSRAPSPSSGAGPATTRFRDEMYDFAQAQPAGTSTSASTSITTAGPRARATSSAPAWAPRSSTTASTTSARSTTSPTWRAPSTTARPRSGPRNAGAQAAAPVRGHLVGHGRTASTPTRCRTRATSRSSRSTGSARCRWRPS